MTEQKYLNAREVAVKLGVCRGSIYQFIKNASFPKGAYFGRCHRWSADDVDNWAKAQAV